MKEKKDTELLTLKLQEFKLQTEKLIESIEKEEADEFEIQLQKRQAIIKEINSITYSKETFQTIAKNLELIKLEKRLQNLVEDKRKDLKFKISNVKEKVNASKNYSRYNIKAGSLLNKTT